MTGLQDLATGKCYVGILPCNYYTYKDSLTAKKETIWRWWSL